MPATKDGLQRTVEFFLYGMLRAAESLGNVEPFLRIMEEEALRKFLLANLPTFKSPASALEGCRAYTAQLDANGLMDTSDTTIRGDEASIQAEIGERCPYRRVCTTRRDEGLPVYCIRGVALTEMLRIRLEADYSPKLEAFGVPCRIRLARAKWG